MISVQDIFEFILKNRRNKVFRNFIEEEILQTIKETLYRRTIIVDTDEGQDKIFGVGMGYPVPCEDKLMHISHILTVRPKGGMARIMKRFTELFPGWNIRAERKGKLVYYKNVINLARKIQIYG